MKSRGAGTNDGMTSFGYALSGEEHRPTDMVRNGRRAEEVGLEFLSISDQLPSVG